MKTVNLKGSKNPSTITSGSKQQNTIVGCVRTDGQSLPPMFIWNRKKLPAELSNGEVPGTIYGLSEKGWIDRDLFYSSLAGQPLLTQKARKGLVNNVAVACPQVPYRNYQ